MTKTFYVLSIVFVKIGVFSDYRREFWRFARESLRAGRLADFIAVLEKALGKKALIDLQPMQPGDVQETYADIAASTRDFGYLPKTPITEGIPKFVEWYRGYHKI